jgi:60 kDa SS-A/Ro ribonucleoprotein
LGYGKIGYFALLRNLRNILEQASELVPDAVSLLTDEKLIRSSLVLPFRFLTAMEEIEQCDGWGVREVLGGISVAIDKATANVPKLHGETLVVLDGSGSMAGKPIKIGSLFAAVLIKANNADYMTFSDDARYQTYNPLDSTITIADGEPYCFWWNQFSRDL